MAFEALYINQLIDFFFLMCIFSLCLTFTVKMCLYIFCPVFINLVFLNFRPENVLILSEISCCSLFYLIILFYSFILCYSLYLDSFLDLFLLLIGNALKSFGYVISIFFLNVLKLVLSILNELIIKCILSEI